MSESSGSTVECPLCEEEFDPTAAGGWCTNSECGEWQYDGGDVGATPVEHQSEEGVPFGDDSPDGVAEPADDPIEQSSDDGSDDGSEDQSVSAAGGEEADMDVSPAETTTASGDDSAAGASESERIEETATTEAAVDESDEATAESAAEPTESDSNAEPETEPEPADSAADDAAEPDAATEAGESDTATEAGESDTATEAGEGDGTEEPAEIDCPSCETTLDADANFCPSCGEDVSAVEPGADELTECPGCGTEVDPDDNFCAACGHDLSDVSADDEDDEDDRLTECPSCGADVEDDDSFCVSCGEDLEAHRGDDASEPAPDSQAAGSGTGESARPAPSELVLSLRGQEVRVSDGQKIGREIRRIITESGGDKDDAVRVHREHLRFVREGEQFYVIDLGANPTTLNGQPMEQGDRKSVDPGDEIGLSGVVSIDVHRP